MRCRCGRSSWYKHAPSQYQANEAPSTEQTAGTKIAPTKEQPTRLPVQTSRRVSSSQPGSQYK
eukprot:768968-Rhodomonas_salina.2